ncbi:hypothetical protein DL95DRAFT_78444 [Leptodontidium sp. 2 PMI_412]|nr:hypothetical protein DL95DRAFT_78444 [Leptodontidium sp. 2 PMI_412]
MERMEKETMEGREVGRNGDARCYFLWIEGWTALVGSLCVCVYPFRHHLYTTVFASVGHDTETVLSELACWKYLL